MKQYDASLYSTGNNDECHTPVYGVLPIIKYLPKDKTIWCPFDTDDSHFVKELRKSGFQVVHSHISYGQDFYEYEPEQWDIIVSNPLLPISVASSSGVYHSGSRLLSL